VDNHAASLATHCQGTASTITSARPTPAVLNVGARDRPDATDAQIDRLQREVRKLGARCRAREHALEHLSGAVVVLRRANHALTDENALLRLELERLGASEAARP
jgi:hypothetical protein